MTTALNIVHMRVKPGREADFEALYRDMDRSGFGGVRKLWVVRTGERSYCVVGEWDSFEALTGARSAMIANLDRFRDLLEDLGGGRGVTEPWSGEAVVEFEA